MSNRIIGSKQLQAVYTVLVLATSVAALQAMVWPRWPSAQPLDQESLAKALVDGGFASAPLPPLPAKRDAELATSSAIGFSMPNGMELRVMRGTARRRFNFQTAFLARSYSQLKITNRDLSSQSPPTAIGLIQNQHARQTCFVEGEAGNQPFGVTRDELAPLIDKASTGNGLKSILGLQPNRNYQCVLIQATSRADAAIDQPTWRRILTAVERGLRTNTQMPAGRST
jgi:hypothetical protein